MSEALTETKQQETALVAPAPDILGVAGLEGLDAGDVRVPQLRLINEKSQVPGATRDTFHCMLTHREYKELRIVPIRISKGRLYLPPYGEADNKPICYSDDALYPSCERPCEAECARRLADGRLFEVCEYGKWRTVNGKRRPGPCRLVYNMIALNLDNGDLPFAMQMRGLNVSPTKRMISYVAQVARGGRVAAICTVSIKMGIRDVQSDYGPNICVEFSDYEAVDPPDKYLPEFERFREAKPQEDDEAEAEETPSDVDDDSDLPF